MLRDYIRQRAKPLALAICVPLLVFSNGCASQPQNPPTVIGTCHDELIILGIGQDAGAPQLGNPNDPAWDDPSLQLFAASAALVNHKSGERYLFEATPDIRGQIQLLDKHAPPQKGAAGLSGIFITHAHIGHYAGLMFLGRESIGADKIPVYAMPRLANFLTNNGPWQQLVTLENINIKPLISQDTTLTTNAIDTQLTGTIMVSAFPVKHRDEYSETVGFVIQGANKSALFLPDIDTWEDFKVTRTGSEQAQTILDIIREVDYAYVDATFFDDNELPGRDMTKIPHPRVTTSMDLFDSLPAKDRRKVRFIHINHTNPIRFQDSSETKMVNDRGYRVARRGEKVCLSDLPHK